MLNRHIPAYGRLDAPFIAIAEAPWKSELKVGRPLVGPSGVQLDNWWGRAGISRSQFRLYNVMEYAAPGGKIERAHKDEVEAWASTLHDRLAECEAPKVIIPMGDIALRALLRKPLWANNSPHISDWRGSILQVEHNGKPVKCIPAYHPAACMYDPALVKICRLDWVRVADEAKLPDDFDWPFHTHYIPGIGVYRTCGPNVDKADVSEDANRDAINRYRDAAQDPTTIMAVDIENPGKRMACVGFSTDPAQSLTLVWPEHVDLITELCESPCTKVLQNGLFDRFWLHPPSAYAPLAERHWRMQYLPAIRMGGEVVDTLAMHHVLDATLPHSLATMTSLYTRQPYYKTQHKDSDSPTIDRDPIDRLCIYNGLDCVCTRALFDIFTAKLKGASHAQ